MPIVPITDDPSTHAGLLAAAEPVHRQLRPDLPPDYAAYLRAMFAEGAEMAVVENAGEVKAIAIYRVYHTTYAGKRFYVDDLVTDARHRSTGHGAQLLAWLDARAIARGCAVFALDSGVQRTRAHAFYFRHGLAIVSFAFTKRLTPGV